MNPIGPTELRVVIQPIRASGRHNGGVPASVFKKVFDAVLAALVAADREVHPKAAASAFHVACLSANPCEFGFVETVRAAGGNAASSIALFRRCAGRVYRSDYRILLQYRRLMRAFQRIVAALDPAYIVLVRYHDSELPLDAFFRRQVDRDLQAFDVRALGYDRWGANEVVHWLKQAKGEGWAKGVAQTSTVLNAPSKELERRLGLRRLRHGGHPVLRWMADNVQSVSDSQGNIKPDRKNSKEKIDGIAALVDALAVMLEAPGPGFVFLLDVAAGNEGAVFDDSQT